MPPSYIEFFSLFNAYEFDVWFYTRTGWTCKTPLGKATQKDFLEGKLVIVRNWTDEDGDKLWNVETRE